MTIQRKKRLTEVVSNRQQGVLVLEDIHDPHNAAACLRSADAFGFQNVYFIFSGKDKSDAAPFNPKRVGKTTSSSANKWLDFKVFNSTKACIKELRKQKYHIVATALTGRKLKSIEQAKFDTPKLAIILGNEHRGISTEAAELADECVYIPMRGMVESFNLSVAATLFLYEITRQRQIKGMKKYLLPTKEKAKLIKEFIRRGTK
jgi:tRNA (guanosine-2'-O-)-methyltransferase